MNPPVAIIDAHVVVSGLLTEDPTAPTAALLDAMLAGRLEFVVSVELLAEYRRVLLRPKVARRHGLSPGEIDVVLERVVENAIAHEIGPPSSPAPDPGDQHLWDLMEAVRGAVLVTGDALLLSAPPTGRSAISPRVCVDAWRAAFSRPWSTKS